MENARQAIDQQIEIMIEDGATVPAPRLLSALQSDPEFAGWVWAVVDVPVGKHLRSADQAPAQQAANNRQQK